MIRHPGLDLFRFLAALIVFSGHAVYFSSYSKNLESNNLLSPIRTGTFAVDFFFTLSGFVLCTRIPNFRWICARVLRLYPAYFFGLVLAILINLLIDNKIGTNLEGLVLNLFGVQALSPSYALALNGPLWSLSVEIITTPLFILFWKIRNHFL
jgi:peptidoglycan/LPS O-acetylase OafA/YrhL